MEAPKIMMLGCMPENTGKKKHEKKNASFTSSFRPFRRIFTDDLPPILAAPSKLEVPSKSKDRDHWRPSGVTQDGKNEMMAYLRGLSLKLSRISSRISIVSS